MVQCCCKTLYTRRSAFNTATTFSGRTSPRIMPLPLVGQELAHVGDPDAVALRMLHPLQIHLEVNGAHDAIAELLVDQRLYGGAVDLRNLVKSGRWWGPQERRSRAIRAWGSPAAPLRPPLPARARRRPPAPLRRSLGAAQAGRQWSIPWAARPSLRVAKR